MKYLKNISMTIGIMLLTILILTLLMTVLNHFNVLNRSAVSVIKIVIIFITLFIGGFIMGRKSNKKGWLEGLKLGLIFSILLLLFNFLGLHNRIELKNLLYYLIIITSSMFGSMIGINKSITNET